MNIIFIGNGGHAGVVADALRAAGKRDVKMFLDETKGDAIKEHPNQMAFIAIGNNEVRARLSKLNFQWVNIIHPTAKISRVDCIGTYFGANCSTGNNSQIGNFSIINTGVILEHDSVVGDFTHLCPGVVTGGRVKIGNRTTIGLGAMIRDGVAIGNNCIIGMGSVVLRDVPDNSVFWGNPATSRNCRHAVDPTSASVRCLKCGMELG
jgi:UDP-N-acetylbacillosamine N-acetyltransferase